MVFSSLQLKCCLSGLSVNVGESLITQSSKVGDLGVIFDQFLNFYDRCYVYSGNFIFGCLHTELSMEHRLN